MCCFCRSDTSGSLDALRTELDRRIACERSVREEEVLIESAGEVGRFETGAESRERGAGESGALTCSVDIDLFSSVFCSCVSPDFWLALSGDLKGLERVEVASLRRRRFAACARPDILLVNSASIIHCNCEVSSAGEAQWYVAMQSRLSQPRL